MSNQNEERQKKIEQTCIMCIREIITSCFNEMNNHNATLLVEPQNIRRVLDIVFSAQPNYDRKDFPDFITDKAFIEHFKVSSSPIMGNNGSEYYKNKKQHDKSVDDFFHNAKSGSSKVVELENKNHSYENLEASFKISWDKHIKKPEINTLYASYTKVFLVEYTEMELQNTTDGVDCQVVLTHFYV